MGGSRRPRSDHHFITVRDGELKNAGSTEILGKGCDGVAFDILTDDVVSWLSSGWLLRLEPFWVFLVFLLLGLEVEVFEGFRSQPRFFTAARKKPGALELACKTVALGVDVQCVDSLQQTPLFYAAREGNVAVARLLLSLGMRVNFVDSDGNTALDYAVVNQRFEMVRLLTSTGAHVNTVSLSKSPAMDALLSEAREKREAHGESRKRKREVESTEACPNGQKRSSIVSWTYSDTEAEEPEILREDVTVIHENEQFLACVFPEKSTTAAKRIRRSAACPHTRYMHVV